MVPLFEKLMVESGIILLKYWLEVSPEEQTRRLEARIDDGRKIWKLSPMDLKSYDRWDDYTKARDEMFAATDTAWAPWFVARSEDKKRVRLNVISHLLKQVPYKARPREKVKLPKRKIGRYKAADYPFKYVRGAADLGVAGRASRGRRLTLSGPFHRQQRRCPPGRAVRAVCVSTSSPASPPRRSCCRRRWRTRRWRACPSPSASTPRSSRW